MQDSVIIEWMKSDNYMRFPSFPVFVIQVPSLTLQLLVPIDEEKEIAAVDGPHLGPCMKSVNGIICGKYIFLHLGKT